MKESSQSEHQISGIIGTFGNGQAQAQFQAFVVAAIKTGWLALN
jgi:hypothetical protein